jgi:hypothetical protein
VNLSRHCFCSEKQIETKGMQCRRLHGNRQLRRSMFSNRINFAWYQLKLQLPAVTPLLCFIISLYSQKDILHYQGKLVASIAITILDIIHLPLFYLTHSVSETGFCLRLQVVHTRLGPIEWASLCLRRQTPTEYVPPGNSAGIQFPKFMF